MTKLRMSEATARAVKTVVHGNVHATLLTGPEGIGLSTLAEYIASEVGQVHTVVRPERKTAKGLPAIPVERVRELYVETRAKLDSINVIIIDDADTMNHVAQNALLKLLEEPASSFRFILTSHAPDKLLPTIRSRVQTLGISPVSALDSRRLLTALGVKDDLTIQRLLYVAEGLPAELTRLAQNESDFKSLSERVIRARQFAEGTAYQRLAVVMSSSDDRSAALRFIETTNLLLRRSLDKSPDQAVVRRIEALLQASEAIRANGNVKLHLAVASLS